MKGDEQYKIAHVGLKPGKHHLQFEIGEKFFEEFEHSVIRKGEFKVKLELEKNPGHFVLEFSINGHLPARCDRCSEQFQMEVAGNYKVFVKFGESTDATEEEDIIYIAHGEPFIEIKQLLYEFINLSLPVKKAHPVKEDGLSLIHI